MFKRFIAYYKPYRLIFFVDLFFAAIIAVSGLILPQIIRYLQREVFVMTDSALMFQTILKYAFILLGVFLIQTGAQYFVTSVGHIMGARMEYDMRRDLFAHIKKLSFSYFDHHNTGHLISRILADLFDITELAHHGPEDVFISLIKLIGAFALLMHISVFVTTILIVVTIVMGLFSLYYNRIMRRTFMNNRKRVADINAIAQDSLSGIRTVISFTNEDLEQEKFDYNNQRFLDSKKENYYVMGRFHSFNGFLQGVMYLSVIIAGGWQISRGGMQSADLVIYILYITTFLDPIKRLINFTEQFQKGYTGFIRMCEILDTEPEIKDHPDAIEAGNLAGEIRFSEVTFHYEEDEPVLNHISLTIPARKTIALVGPSGAGKTTFCSLIPRFYDVTSGQVMIDGRDVRDYTLNSLRSNIGVVQQDVYIFNTSVRENIAYGSPQASDEEIIEAAKRANIHDFIMSLPQGYQTSMGEHGVRFSGGQKQRISIARVFLQNPPILILDEATSSLDNESEIYIQKSLEELAKDRTTLVIAHRLSTIRNADEILVLTEEGIAERGSHRDLMSLNGLYAKLYNMQFSVGTEAS